MVLVAAVAAAVLINTTGTLQQRAQATGTEATQEVASNIKLLSVYGHRNASTSCNAYDCNVDKITLAIELSAGAVPLDLTKLIVRYSDGSNTRNFNYGWQDGDGFNTTWVRGSNNSAVMQAGDLVELRFNTWNYDGVITTNGIPTRTAVAISMIPETGSAVLADFKTPATYGTSTVITLR